MIFKNISLEYFIHNILTDVKVFHVGNQTIRKYVWKKLPKSLFFINPDPAQIKNRKRLLKKEGEKATSSEIKGNLVHNSVDGQNNDKEAHLSQKQTVQMDVDSQNTTTTNGDHLEAFEKNGCRSKQRSRNWHFTKKKKEKKNGPCFNQSLNDSRRYDR